MRTSLAVLLLFCLAGEARAEGFAGLTPGRSTRADAEQQLGKATVRDGVLCFPGDRFDAKDVRVRIAGDTGVIESILIRPAQPPSRQKVLGWFGAEDAALSVEEGEDRLETVLPGMVRIRVRDGKVTELAYLARPAVLKSIRDAAIQQAAEGQVDQAVSMLAHVIRAEPTNADAHFTTGAILQNSERPQEALLAVQRGLELSPLNEEGELLRSFIEGDLAMPRAGWLGVHWHGRDVADVFTDTPGGSALKPGDRLLAVDNERVQGHEHAAELLHRLEAGQDVALQVLRDGRQLSVQMRAIDPRRYLQRMETPEDELEQIPVLVAAGDLTAALKLLSTQFESPRPPAVVYELALIVQRCRLQNGLKAWKLFLDRADGQTPKAWREHAREAAAAIEARLPAYEKALEFRRERNDEEALRLLQAMEPYGCGISWMALGSCLRDLKRHGPAAEATLAGLRWFPDAYVGWNILASCYEIFDLARCRAATVRALRAMDRWRGKPIPEKHRDEALQRKERVEKALQLRILGDRCAEAKLWRQAIEHYRAAASLVPVSQELALLQTRHLIADAGQPDEAARV
ncbi:MAG: PDZ domain-containing protein, partial [Armatimonadota bacterium]